MNFSKKCECNFTFLCRVARQNATFVTSFPHVTAILWVTAFLFGAAF